MPGASDQPEGAVTATTPAIESNDPTQALIPSPARSDKSSDSEGKEVRDKLKETQIDAQATSHPTSGADPQMKNAPHGSANTPDLSTSGSDSERGQLRRKRSREEFEEEAETEKQSAKKTEGGSERHRRKKSRDISKDVLPVTKPAPSTISRIEENDVDEPMISPKKDKTSATASDNASGTGTGTSPKNKRTREQAEQDAEVTEKPADNVITNGKPVAESSDERDTKRFRDEQGAQSNNKNAESKTKVQLYARKTRLQLTQYRFHRAAALRTHPRRHLLLRWLPNRAQSKGLIR